MSEIDKTILQKFIQLASEKLEGEWLLIGGNVLPLLGVEYRTTMDIDFIGLGKKEQSQQLELMKLAQELGLPAESINQAGLIFLERISDYAENLVLIQERASVRLYRPNSFLFLQLKVNRLSESDLSDCIEMIKISKKDEEAFLLSRSLSFFKKVLKKSKYPNRVQELIELLEKH